MVLLDPGGDVNVGEAAGLGDRRFQHGAFFAGHAVDKFPASFLRAGKGLLAHIGKRQKGTKAGVYVDGTGRIEWHGPPDGLGRQYRRKRHENSCQNHQGGTFTGERHSHFATPCPPIALIDDGYGRQVKPTKVANH